MAKIIGGAARLARVGLGQMFVGVVALVLLPAWLGVVGFGLAVVLLTPGYQLFQAANNTAVMGDVDADRRGVVSGLLHLARNLGLITGASLLGAVFAWGVASPSVTTASPAAVTAGMQLTFAVAALGLMVAAVWLVAGARLRAQSLAAV